MPWSCKVTNTNIKTAVLQHRTLLLQWRSGQKVTGDTNALWGCVRKDILRLKKICQIRHVELPTVATTGGREAAESSFYYSTGL